MLRARPTSVGVSREGCRAGCGRNGLPKRQRSKWAWAKSSTSGSSGSQTVAPNTRVITSPTSQDWLSLATHQAAIAAWKWAPSWPRGVSSNGPRLTSQAASEASDNSCSPARPSANRSLTSTALPLLSSVSKCQPRRQHAQEKSRSFRSLAASCSLKNPSMALGLSQVAHWASVMASLLAQEQVDEPAPSHVGPSLLTAVAEDLLVLAPRVFQNVGKDPEQAEVGVVVNGLGDGGRGLGAPGGVDGHRAERQRAEEVSE